MKTKLMSLIIILAAQLTLAKAGENISTATDTLSSSSTSTAIHSISPPASGARYVVKVNFLKVETAVGVANGWIDQASSSAQEKSRMHTLFDHARKSNSYASAKSSATFTVLDPSGRVIETKEAALLTLGRKVEFTATTSGTYTVRLKCASGAGLYHMVFETK